MTHLRELIEDGEKRLHEIEEKKADRPIGTTERA